MRNLIFIFLFFGIATLYIGCSDSNPSAPALSQDDQVTNTLDKKPAANLIGEMDLIMTSHGWDGPITFEDGSTYGIRFIHLGDKMTPGQVAYHFWERWEIYDPGDPTTVLMTGPDEGVSPGPKWPDPTKYVMNGYVEEAYGIFTEWLGRNVHMSGVMTPLTAPGTFRAN
jgi:hypothetical protein